MSISKIKTLEELKDLRISAKNNGLLVGYTSGVFDLLHAGHVEYLERAKQECALLIVGINSDSSVKENKGDLRPIVSENDRASVLAGLGCVDYVFIFNDKNNNSNIETLKPDLYMKASDYGVEKLSSAPIVEKYGGKVVLIPMKEGRSSTKIIEKIVAAYASDIHGVPDDVSYSEGPAVFIDRDGTINKEVEYLSDPAKFELIPNALEGMKKFQELGYRIVVVTNQPGIGLGYYEKADLFKVNGRLLAAAGKLGINIHKIYFCPHSKAEGCGCRKPKAGMLIRAQKELNIDLTHSIMIGDTTADIAAGKAAGCKTILVQTGKGGSDKLNEVTPDYIVADLFSAVEIVSKLKK